MVFVVQRRRSCPVPDRDSHHSRRLSTCRAPSDFVHNVPSMLAINLDCGVPGYSTQSSEKYLGQVCTVLRGRPTHIVCAINGEQDNVIQ